jgi:hypothetical protein
LVIAKEDARYTSQKKFTKSPTYFFLRKDYFPLTLSLSPFGERGKGETGLMPHSY